MSESWMPVGRSSTVWAFLVGMHIAFRGASSACSGHSDGQNLNSTATACVMKSCQVLDRLKVNKLSACIQGTSTQTLDQL